jgi:short subunit dehydrogenase-like uncharacterized protein
MTSRIVVFGATGYAGELAVDALLRRGVRPVVAGRRESELQEFSNARGGLDYRVADATLPESVRALVGPGDVLVSAVGPFAIYGHVAAEAAASVGAHYVDATGEVGFVQELRERYHELAVEHDATMLPAYGYDFVPGILAGSLALHAAGERGVVTEIGYFATGSLKNGLSKGTRATSAEGAAHPSLVWRDGGLREERTGARVRVFDVRGRGKAAFLLSGTETMFLPQEFPQLKSVEVFNGWFPHLARLVGPSLRVSSFLNRSESGRRLVRWIGSIGLAKAQNPDAEERSRTRTYVVARIRDAAGEVIAETHVEGPSIYTLTGELLAEAAILLHEGKGRTAGVVGPIQAFGPDLFEESCARVGLAPVSL